MHAPSFPVAALAPSARGLLIIANELALVGAGSGGATGSADLLALDDTGEVWLIEAKLVQNPQVTPAYVFGAQLMRYAHALVRDGLEGAHRHLQDFAFGRRPNSQPPAHLAVAWQSARTLVEMVAPWLASLGRNPAEAGDVVARAAARVRRGDILLAVLTDEPVPALAAWCAEYEAQFQTAVLVATPAGVTVVRRTPHRITAVDDPPVPALPPFLEIPQSFQPTPETLPMVLSEGAFHLYATVVQPQLQQLFGDPLPSRPIRDSTSFSYCARNVRGLPVTVKIGRGDIGVHKGTASAQPGNHALTMAVILKWACDAVFVMPRSSPDRVAAAASLYQLASDLVFRADFKFRNASVADARNHFDACFMEGFRTRTLMLFPSNGSTVADYGAEGFDAAVDAARISAAFAAIAEAVGAERPATVIERPTRVPYARGHLTDLSIAEIRAAVSHSTAGAPRTRRRRANPNLRSSESG